MYMSQNVVDLVDLRIFSERRFENLNICMSQNVVDLVNFALCISQQAWEAISSGIV